MATSASSADSAVTAGSPSDGKAGRRSTGVVDQASMRATNMGVILRYLRDHGGQSRAELSTATGLSRTAMSELITELVRRGLVREGAAKRHGSVGRPGQSIDLDGSMIAGVGVEINVDYIAVAAVDLTGKTTRELQTPTDMRSLSVSDALDLVAGVTDRVIRSLREAGNTVAAVTISPPGFIDYDTQVLRFAPNLGWRDIALAQEVQRRIGDPNVAVSLENDAKLGAIAALAQVGDRAVRDLVYLTGQIGVGAGIISDGRLLRGWSGISGEVGHLPLGDPGVECSCGRHGCWETAVGISAFLDLATDPADASRRSSLALEQRFASIRQRLAAGDEHTTTALRDLIDRLVPGLSLMVDVLNPRLIVLGGYFAQLGDYLIEPIEAALADRRIDQGSQTRVTASSDGAMTAAIGGALLAVEHVFEDPTSLELAATG